jgi:hypothetical protein
MRARACLLLQLAFAGHLNNLLRHDEVLKSLGYLPMGTESNSLFEAICDGVVLWYARCCCSALFEHCVCWVLTVIGVCASRVCFP